MIRDPSSYPPLRTCVSPEGHFVYGRHDPGYRTANLRMQDYLQELGRTLDGDVIMNTANFPPGDVSDAEADTVFEIPNPLPFRGVTYICKRWASRAAADPAAIGIDTHQPALLHSMHSAMGRALGPDRDDTADVIEKVMAQLPMPVKLALATTSGDPRDLVRLAAESCRFVIDPNTGRPTGLVYSVSAQGGLPQPLIHHHELFEAVANNPCLPDDYKKAMVLRPGAQGTSEIVGEWRTAGGSHIFEYLRRNSYIAWGHYAANMADDAVRYAAGDLSLVDIQGLRHLYYQRTYVRLAEALQYDSRNGRLPRRRVLSEEEMENLRRWILNTLRQQDATAPLQFTATLWGWNYGFDYAPSGYRLHASHQQVHQQFALIPEHVPVPAQVPGRVKVLDAYACGDPVHDFVQEFRQQTGGKDFFDCYLQAIRTNSRLDGDERKPSSLVVYEDEQVILFVPKAQTSQWELQLMPLSPAGHILETDSAARKALDRVLLTAMQILTAMGARMITVLEYSKRFTNHHQDQRLLYVFLPRLPQSPGAFSEAQLRWINGHYPEDFAAACRMRLRRHCRISDHTCNVDFA